MHAATDTEDKIAFPARHFSTSADVMLDDGLTHDEKIRVLESWFQDAKRLSESEAENMSGGEGNLVREVSIVLSAVKAAAGSS